MRAQECWEKQFNLEFPLGHLPASLEMEDEWMGQRYAAPSVKDA
jgi:hypothetical protein